MPSVGTWSSTNRYGASSRPCAVNGRVVLAFATRPPLYLLVILAPEGTATDRHAILEVRVEPVDTRDAVAEAPRPLSACPHEEFLVGEHVVLSFAVAGVTEGAQVLALAAASRVDVVARQVPVVLLLAQQPTP